ncbi:hypothetical protein BYT27DRAFT_7184469 [Phlegmacium glaucopus]|nr:hypothetical protein BYT27DRAFT_7184469 [Phlegmacium glaucopus]
MHREHDALPVVASNGDSALFVAATLAALVLAGSALVYRQAYEHRPERGKLTQPSEQFTPDDADTESRQPLDAHGYAAGDSSSTHDPDSKESKNSRSKDRRRRGKDPLKEILKGGKKVKSAATTPVKQLFSAPSSPALFNTNGAPSSFSRGSGKRAQQDDSLVNLPETSVGTTSSAHSRTTSEVSQSNTGSRIPDQPHPHQHTHDRTASSISISEDHVLTPSQSYSSSHNGTEAQGISEERNPDILSRQARETLPVPTPRIFSTIQNNDDFSEILNHSAPCSSASSATNTTTASCVITPATSPSLSYTSSKLVPAPGPVGDPALNNGSGSDCGPKNNSVLEPSHALDTDTKSRNIPRKQQLLPNPTSSKFKSKTKTNVPTLSEWDNAREAVSVLPSSSISAPVIASAPLSTPTSSLITAPAFPPDIVYRKPPRLQSKSLWSKNAKNDASSSIPGSVSHPSLPSPTSGSFVPLEGVPNRESKVVEEDEGGESGEVEERETLYDSYTQLEFPTLNPTVLSSSSLASNGNGGPTASSSAAGPSNNHRPTTPRRAHGSRRPTTPSANTPPPHSTASSTSGSGSAQPPTQIPAVSTQTQLASLRGALEAARLREEKYKAEMERYTKELEVLRWENVNSKRGEVELQNHIRHLMHQLHMYTSLFASVSPPPTSQQTQGPIASSEGLSNPVDGAASGPGSSNGPTTISSPGTPNPATAVVPGPVSSPVSSPVSASGIFPPSMHAPSPYFPYPMPPPPLHPHAVMPSPHLMFAQQFHHMQQQFLQFQQYQQHQPHMQNQSQSPTIQAQQASLISMLHPPSSATISSYQPSTASSSSSITSRSRSSSRPGTESTGSLSPDLNGSPNPVPGAKRRKRMQTGNGYIGGLAGRDDTTDGWVVGGVTIDEGDERGHESIHECEEQGNNGDGDENGGGYNELVADAIFKRPESIGVRAGKKSKQALLEKERSRYRELGQLENEVLSGVEPLTEFKFPSLSDSGNVYNGGHNRSSSSSLPLVASQTPEDLGSDVFDLRAVADRPPQDVVHIEVVSQNGAELDNHNENQSSSNTASSSSESEGTPHGEESESNVTEPLMDLNGVEATNVPQGQ